MRSFSGISHHKVDTKGRVSIPAGFRRVLEANDPDLIGDGNPSVAIVYGIGGRFLDCYSVNAFNDLQEKIKALPLGTLERVNLTRIYVGQSHVTQVDPNGRLVLPQKLRDLSGISDQVCFEGWMDTFRIFSQENYASAAKGTKNWLDELGTHVDPLSLLSCGEVKPHDPS